MAVGLAVALSFVALGFVINAVEPVLRPGTTPVLRPGTTRLGRSVGAAVCLGLVVVCSRWDTP